MLFPFFFKNYLNTCCPLNTTAIFGRRRRSCAAGTPAKYECYSRNLTHTFTKYEMSLRDKLRSEALVTPIIDFSLSVLNLDESLNYKLSLLHIVPRFQNIWNIELYRNIGMAWRPATAHVYELSHQNYQLLIFENKHVHSRRSVVMSHHAFWDQVRRHSIISSSKCDLVNIYHTTGALLVYEQRDRPTTILFS